LFPVEQRYQTYKGPDDKCLDADRERRHATQQKSNQGTEAGNTKNLKLKLI